MGDHFGVKSQIRTCCGLARMCKAVLWSRKKTMGQSKFVFNGTRDLLTFTFCTHFYRTQVSLGSGLWVPVSLTPYLQDFFLNWRMMPTGQFGVDGRHLDGGRAQCGVGKVVVQELHGMLATIYVVGPLGR